MGEKEALTMAPWKVKVDAKGHRFKIGLKGIFPWARRLFHISLGLKITHLPADAGADDTKPSFSRRFAKKFHRILQKCGIGRKRSSTKKRFCSPDSGAGVGQFFGGLRDRVPAKVWRVLGVVSILAVFNCSVLHFLFALF